MADAEVVEYAVICGPEDDPALWAAGELRRRGLPVRLVTTEELVYAPRITHTVSAGGAEVAVRLLDGAVLGPGLRGTLNRVSRIPTAHLGCTPEVERDYVLQELQAVLVSLLHALPGTVVGRPDPRGLGGAWWRPPEWLAAAGRAGLVGYGWRSGGVDAVPAGVMQTVLVVGEALVTSGGVALPDPVRAGCERLARDHGSGLVGLDFAVLGDDWRFVGGNPLPDLRLGGSVLADALHEALLAGHPVAVPA